MITTFHVTASEDMLKLSLRAVTLVMVSVTVLVTHVCQLKHSGLNVSELSVVCCATNVETTNAAMMVPAKNLLLLSITHFTTALRVTNSNTSVPLWKLSATCVKKRSVRLPWNHVTRPPRMLI